MVASSVSDQKRLVNAGNLAKISVQKPPKEASRRLLVNTTQDALIRPQKSIMTFQRQPLHAMIGYIDYRRRKKEKPVAELNASSHSSHSTGRRKKKEEGRLMQSGWHSSARTACQQSDIHRKCNRKIDVSKYLPSSFHQVRR